MKNIKTTYHEYLQLQKDTDDKIIEFFKQCRLIIRTFFEENPGIKSVYGMIKTYPEQGEYFNSHHDSMETIYRNVSKLQNSNAYDIYTNSLFEEGDFSDDAINDDFVLDEKNRVNFIIKNKINLLDTNHFKTFTLNIRRLMRHEVLQDFQLKEFPETIESFKENVRNIKPSIKEKYKMLFDMGGAGLL